MNQQIAAKQNQLTDSLEQLPTVMEGKIQSRRSELATTEQRIAEVGGRRAYVIRAPAPGRISTLQATVGQFADPRLLQMEIIPNERSWPNNIRRLARVAFGTVSRPGSQWSPLALPSRAPER